MENSNRIRVKKVYPIIDKQYLMVHLDTDEFTHKFGYVSMIIEEEIFKMNFIGISNINGVPVLRIVPLDWEWFDLISKKILSNGSDNLIYIELLQS